MKSPRGGGFPLVCGLATGLVFAAATAGIAQNDQQHGTVERIKVHGKSLEGNLEGDSPDRDVSIYLPPSYKSSRNRRYPVIYMLHGYTDSDDKWFRAQGHFINIPEVLDKALPTLMGHEMILVMPNAYTRYQGSMYSSSVTTGDWESYVAKDLVAYIDSHYRTIAEAASRGLSGHSMGGYGTVRIGMKFPEVFSSLYILSPCCMTPPNPQQGGRGGGRAEAIKTDADLEKADFGTKAQIASAAAWSPNPKNPPLFFDLATKDGQPQPMVSAKWAANAPLAMVDQYIPNLKKLHAIAFDAGLQDVSIAASIKVLDQILTDYAIPHTYETYEGTHTSGVAVRVETKVMPFFAKQLSFEQGKRK